MKLFLIIQFITGQISDPIPMLASECLAREEQINTTKLDPGALGAVCVSDPFMFQPCDCEVTEALTQ